MQTLYNDRTNETTPLKKNNISSRLYDSEAFIIRNKSYKSSDTSGTILSVWEFHSGTAITMHVVHKNVLEVVNHLYVNS